MNIFLSYASEQAILAEEVQLALVGARHEVFFDKAALPPGGDFNTRIRQAIHASDGMVFLISPHSVRPGSYALTELEFAKKKWRHPSHGVLPVLTEPTDLQSQPYLRAATYLEPKGNVAAEVAYAAEQMFQSAPQPDVVRTISVFEQEVQKEAGKLAAAQAQQRPGLAEYFDNIGACLHEVHRSLAADVIPHGRCSELETYADMFPQVVGNYVGKERAEELSGLLAGAYRVEGLWYDFRASPDKKQQLPSIEKLAGKFDALANAIRAGWNPAPRP